MSFDPNVYAQLVAVNPAAAQAYLDSTQQAAPSAAPSPAPQATFQAPPAAAPQAQGQQFYQNQAAVTPAPVLARGTLEDFYNQPTGQGGGPSVTSKFFNKRIQGSWLDMTVINDVTNADVRQQTDPSNKPQTFRDGRPKFVLIVKVKVNGSSDGTHVTEFPDGTGTIWVKGVLADELRRSMAAAGDPSGYPKAGARIIMTSAGEQAARTTGFAATKLYKLDYANPAGTQVDPTATQTASVPAAAPTVSVPTAVPAAAPTPNPAPAPSISTPDVPAAAANAPTPPPAPQVSATRDELLARLQGN